MARTGSYKTLGNWSSFLAVAALMIVVVIVMGVLYFRSDGDLGVTPAVSESPLICGTPMTSAPLPSPKSVALGEVDLARTDSVTISVLGDSTGNDATDWVILWAQHLAEDCKVVVHRWNATKQQYEKDPLLYGTGAKTVTISNASQPGADADFAVGIVPTVQPKQPDLVIYNFGHNNTSLNVGPQLSATQNAVASQWGQIPSVVMVQNPGQHAHGLVQKETLIAVARWADANGEPPVVVRSAFEADLPRLMLDDVHPNQAGMKVWARVVEAAIG